MFWTVVEQMETHKGLIDAESGWSAVELTPRGVLYAEERALPPAEEVQRHQAARTEMLAHLVERSISF